MDKLTFLEAVEAMKAGKTVTKPEGQGFFKEMYMDEMGVLTVLGTDDRIFYPYLNVGRYTEENWIIVDHPKNKGQSPPVKDVDKTLDNTTADQAQDQVSDIKFWGDGDTFQLISKASSKAEGWMKNTKAMDIPGAGCVVQVTTQQHGRVAEALAFVPNVHLIHIKDEDGKVLRRTLKRF